MSNTPKNIDIPSPLYDGDNFPQKIIDIMWGLVSKEFMNDVQIRKIFPSTIAYMSYWYQRFNKLPDEQWLQKQKLLEYIQYWSNRTVGGIKTKTNADLINTHDLPSMHEQDVEKLLASTEFLHECTEYVLNSFPTRKTVDLFVTIGEKHVNEWWDLKFLTINRDEFPRGNALPWGIIAWSDEQNPYNIPWDLFAALRVAWAKVLELPESELEYGISDDDQSYFVKAKKEERGLTLNKKNVVGYRHRDSINNMIEPSDPRHIVDTMWYKLEYFWDIVESQNRTHYQDIKKIGQKDLIFPHQRKLLRWLSAKTESMLENDKTHHEFIREIIENPKEVYDKLRKRFEGTDYAPDTSMPEFLSTVKYLESELYTDRINNLCKNDHALLWMRDIVFNNLNHLHLGNRKICPYLHTIVSVEKAIEFFDVITRKEMGFYEDVTVDKPIVHDPSVKDHARYHGYKYQYRFNDYFHNPAFKKEILLPTFLHVGATDLMRMRWVPLRIAGISTDKLYVDEFEQTPLEFWCHDLNHCRRYAISDIVTTLMRMWINLEEFWVASSWAEFDFITVHNILFEEKIPIEDFWNELENLYEESSKDTKEYMQNIIIHKDDSPDVKAKKRLKKIILFEIVHEDARVFLKDIILDIFLKMEWTDVPFERRSFDPEKNEWTVVDIQEAYIHTLSYVRYKLQEWFYDTFDDQKSYIVDKDFRYSRNIADVAYEMLNELDVDFDWSTRPDIPLDEYWKPTKERLMERIRSYWPPEIQEPKFIDPDKEKYYKNQKSATTRQYNV